MPGILNKSDKGTAVYDIAFKTTKTFHMKNLYKFIYEYLMEEGWRSSMDEGNDDTSPETYYEEWVMPNGFIERRIWWRLQLNPETPPNSRYMYYMDITFRNLYIKNVDTVVGGRKSKAQDGEVNIEATAYLRMFYDDVEKHPILKYFFYFFKNRWIKNIFEGYRNDLRFRMRKFQDAINQFFTIETYEDDQKNFHLDKGI